MMDLLLATSGGEAQAASGGYVDDVFSAYTYTGSGSTQTINNGIDLAGKGGLVWIKDRVVARNNLLQHSVTAYLSSNNTNSSTSTTPGVTSFGSSGFTVGTQTLVNVATESYVSWTFRKAPKFFDVVTYTGNGASNRALSHQLNADVGMVMVKATSTTGDWWVFHRSATGDLVLNTTAAQTASKANIPSATSSTFTVNGSANTNGVQYVAYLFAHDPSADGIIQCGSFTTDEYGVSTLVNLGWEPQFLITKTSSSEAAGGWNIFDQSRNFIDHANYKNSSNRLFANTSAAESVNSVYQSPTATGSNCRLSASVDTYIYLAIRRPNKPPTSGTQVYNAIARTGTGAAATVTGVGFAPDLAMCLARSPANVAFGASVASRLIGIPYLRTSIGNSEINSVINPLSNSFSGFLQDGISIAGAASDWNDSSLGPSYINHFFRRAKGFFDVVCYTGTGVARTVNHSLGVAPELMIVKSRSQSADWEVLASSISKRCSLNSTSAFNTTGIVAAFGDDYIYKAPDSALLYLGSGGRTGVLSQTYVAYLFASLAGISKVSSYTGNGTSQTINCGFSTGARFILIKRTDATGDWYVWDSVRGIVAANDPHLSLNTTAAEVTTDDSVDPEASGFIVNQNTTTNINVNGGQYIFLAIA